MCVGGKDMHAYVDTFMMSAYVNMLKSLQAFFCFSRMSTQIKYPYVPFKTQSIMF